MDGALTAQAGTSRMDCNDVNQDSENPSDAWELVTGRKRTIIGNRDPRKQKKTELEVPTSNSFAVLRNINDQHPQQQSNDQTNNTKPPPIFITGVENYAALISFLQVNAGPNSFLLKTTSKGVTVYPQSANDYRKLVSCLRTSGAEFHTYQLSEDRNPRIVIKDLHHNTPVEEIKRELEKYGYQTVGITNAISRFKRPLPMFFVDITKATFNEKIFDIKTVYYTKVVIEEPRKKKIIPQCVRCQKYGHTRSYCNYSPRCVRCGQNHESSTCNKTRETPATCANCQGDHPANYRGCQTLRDLRAKRNTGNHIHQRVTPPSLNLKNFPPVPKPSRSIQEEQQQVPARHQLPLLPQISDQQQALSHMRLPTHLLAEEKQSTANLRQDNTQQSPSVDNMSSPQLFQLLNGLNTLIQPLFTLLQQLAHMTQVMCLQNGP